MPELSTIGISASLLLSLTSLILVVLMLTGVLGDNRDGAADDGDDKTATQKDATNLRQATCGKGQKRARGGGCVNKGWS